MLLSSPLLFAEMDSQDHFNHPAGQENRGVHLCHKCGWPFTNPHPNAKHRRAHRKLCGIIEGYKLVDSEETSHCTVSDDDHLSDDDHHDVTPSSSVKKIRSNTEMQGSRTGERSNISQDEVFADAVTDFTDSGSSPGTFESLRSSKEGEIMKSQPNYKEVNPSFGPPLRDTSWSSQNQISEVSVFNLLEKAEDLESRGERSLITEEPGIEPAADEGALKKNQIKIDAEIGISQEKQNNDATEFLTETVAGNRETDLDKTLLDFVIPPNDDRGEASEKVPKSWGIEDIISNCMSADAGVHCSEEEPCESVKRAGAPNGLPTGDTCIENIEGTCTLGIIKLDGVQEMESDPAQISTKYHEEKNTQNDNLHVLSLHGDVPIVDNADVMVHRFKNYKGEKLLPILIADYIELSSDGKVFNHEDNSELSAIEMDDSEDVQEKNESTKMIFGRLPDEREATVPQMKGTANQCENFEESEAFNDLILIEIDKSDIIPSAEQQPLHSDASLTRCSPEPGTALSSVDPTAAVMDSGVKETINLAVVDDASSAKEAVTGVCELSINNEINRTTQENPKKEISVAFGADFMALEAQNFSKLNLSDGQNAANHEESKNDRYDESLTDGGATIIASGSKENQSMKKEKPFENEREQSSIISGDVSPVPESKIVESENGQLSRIMGNRESVKEAESSHKEEVQMECAGKVGVAAEYLNEVVEVLQNASEDHIMEHLVSSSDTSSNDENSVNIEEKNCSTRADGGSVAQSLHGKGDKSATQHVCISTADASGDSSSRTDSLEGHWGSVSVISAQSDIHVTIGGEPGPSKSSSVSVELEKISSENSEAMPLVHIDKSDMYEPPSFMTLVEPKAGGDQEAAAAEIQTMGNQGNAKAASLQAGWFPSLANVVNESEARKKNEEKIAKISSWSTGKQHPPLKSLLGVANAAAKSKSANMKEGPVFVNQESGSTTKNEGNLFSKFGSSPGAVVQVAEPDNKDSKEWNSLARFPTNIKREKRKVKGRAYWAQFVCCSSVN